MGRFGGKNAIAANRTKSKLKNNMSHTVEKENEVKNVIKASYLYVEQILIDL